MSSQRQRTFSRRGLLRVAARSAALAAAAPLLQACAGSAPPAPTPQVVTKEVEKVVTQVVERTVEKVITATPAPQAKAPIKLTISTDWNIGVRRKAMEFWATEFKKQNPNVTVEVWHLGSGGMTTANYSPTVQTMLLTGTGPSVVTEMWWRPNEVYIQLDDFLKSKGFKKEDYFYSPYMQEAEDGKIYGVPFGTYFDGMVANLDIFEKAGVPLPPKEWTFQDMVDTAKKLRKDDVWGYERTNAMQGGWASRMASEGVEWYDRKELKTTIHIGKDGGKPQEMFVDWWNLTWKDGVAPKPAEAAQLLQIARSAGVVGGLASALVWVSGKIGMSWFPFNQAGVVKEMVNNRFRYKAIWPFKSHYSGRRGYFLEHSTNTANKDVGARGHRDEALELLYFWISDPMQKFHAENVPVFPAARKWWSSKELLNALPGMEEMAPMADEALKIGLYRTKYMDGGTGSSPNSFDWWTAVKGKIEDRALIGGEDPVASYKAAIEEGDKALAKKV
jgi:ABC-type glycerol-3-phosphate transport system substrate-binding protein